VQVTSDPSDRFSITVDTDADPVDVDDALVEFAIRFLESTPVGASTADRFSHPEA